MQRIALNDGAFVPPIKRHVFFFFSSELLAKLRGLSQVHQDQGSRLRPVQTVLEDVLVALP